MNRRQASAAILAATVFPELPRAIAGAHQPGYALGERIPLRAEYGALYFDVRTRRLHVAHPALPASFDGWEGSETRRLALTEFGQRRGWRHIAGLLPTEGTWLSAESWGSEFALNNRDGGLRVTFSGPIIVCYNLFACSEARHEFLRLDMRQDRVVLYHAWCDNPAPEEMA